MREINTEEVCRKDFKDRFGLHMVTLQNWCRYNGIAFPPPCRKEIMQGGALFYYLAADIQKIMELRKKGGC